MKNKNILLIVRSLYINVGGVEKMSIRIANGLASKGYKISILHNKYYFIIITGKYMAYNRELQLRKPKN